MSTQQEMNAYLQRAIKPGTKYNSLFPESSCKSNFISNGDTFFTMDHIKKVITKYHPQVARFAHKELKALPLSKVAMAIYQFQYNHFQYYADSLDQNVRTPQCAWASRKEGLDCKSFSVFAGSCLAVLGYKFYIRKINTNPDDPKDYSHVYIVLPKDQKKGSLIQGHYIIDGTSHSNTESPFITKHDVYMDLPHYTLNGVKNRSLRMPQSTLVESGFIEFLKYLRGVGVPTATVTAIQNEVNTYLVQGIDPPFGITQQGVTVGNKGFSFTGTGRTQAQLRNPQAYINEQLGTSQVSQGRSQTAQGGGEAAAIAEVAQLITDSGFFQTTFGEIFQNGFDLSCWNSATSVSRVTKNIEVDFPRILKQSGIEGAVNATTVRNLFYHLEIYRMGMQVLDQDKFAKCTREGGRHGNNLTTAFIDYIQGAVNATLQSSNKRLVSTGTETRKGPHELAIASDHSGGRIRLGETLQVKKFSIRTVQGQEDTSSNPGIGIIPIPNTITSSSPNNTGNGSSFPGSLFSNAGTPSSNSPTGVTVNTASTNTAIGVIVLAAGAYYLYEQSQKKKSKTPKA